MTRKMVVAPHPDDEVLGCASMLLSSEVTVVHVTDGVPPWTAKADREGLEAQRGMECIDAWGVLSCRADRVHLGFPDLTAWQAVEEIADSLARAIDTAGCEEVYLPAYQGGHPDHDASCLAGMVARQLLRPGVVQAWWVYGLYGFDEARRVCFGWLPPSLYGPTETRGEDSDLLRGKAEALSRFTSQVWPESALDLWIRHPVPERFAPLPASWDRLPDLPCYYDEVLGFARHGASALAVAAAFNRVLGARSLH
ncbi:MAG: PIG-L deacetylase family protein [Acidimicrobiales bacterium]